MFGILFYVCAFIVLAAIILLASAFLSVSKSAGESLCVRWFLLWYFVIVVVFCSQLVVIIKSLKQDCASQSNVVVMDQYVSVVVTGAMRCSNGAISYCGIVVEDESTGEQFFVNGMYEKIGDRFLLNRNLLSDLRGPINND